MTRYFDFYGLTKFEFKFLIPNYYVWVYTCMYKFLQRTFDYMPMFMRIYVNVQTLRNTNLAVFFKYDWFDYKTYWGFYDNDVLFLCNLSMQFKVNIDLYARVLKIQDSMRWNAPWNLCAFKFQICSKGRRGTMRRIRACISTLLGLSFYDLKSSTNRWIVFLRYFCYVSMMWKHEQIGLYS